MMQTKTYMDFIQNYHLDSSAIIEDRKILEAALLKVNSANETAVTLSEIWKELQDNLFTLYRIKLLNNPHLAMLIINNGALEFLVQFLDAMDDIQKSEM